MFQKSSMRLSCITSKVVWVALVTSMYFNGIGHDSSLGVQSLTLGSTWWRWMQPPEMDQKSSCPSPASGNELEMLCGWRPFWFSQEVMMTFSSNCLIPYQSGCFQCLISSRWLYCSICDWENEFFTTFKQHHLFCIESFSMDFWCVHLFQLLNIRDLYVSFPDSPRAQYIAMEDSTEHFLSKLMDSWLIFCGNWMTFNQGTKWKQWSFKWISTTSLGVFPSDKRSWIFRS